MKKSGELPPPLSKNITRRTSLSLKEFDKTRLYDNIYAGV